MTGDTPAESQVFLYRRECPLLIDDAKLKPHISRVPKGILLFFSYKSHEFYPDIPDTILRQRVRNGRAKSIIGSYKAL